MGPLVTPYASFRPTGFDPRGLGATDDPEDGPVGSWLVAPCGRNRDSGTLTESNFETLLRLLRAVDPDREDHAVHGFNHWGPGWFEIILVRPGSPAATVADEAEASLEDYPVLDDEDHSRREWEGACDYWQHAGLRDRIEACSRSRVSIFAARRDDMPEDCYEYCHPDRC